MVPLVRIDSDVDGAGSHVDTGLASSLTISGVTLGHSTPVQETRCPSKYIGGRQVVDHHVHRPGEWPSLSFAKLHSHAKSSLVRHSH